MYIAKYAREVYSYNRQELMKFIMSDWFKENVYNIGIPIIEKSPYLVNDIDKLYDNFTDDDYMGIFTYFIIAILNNNFVYYYKLPCTFYYAVDHTTIEDIAYWFLDMHEDRRIAIVNYERFRMMHVNEPWFDLMEAESDPSRKVDIVYLQDTKLLVNWLADWIKRNINNTFKYYTGSDLKLP